MEADFILSLNTMHEAPKHQNAEIFFIQCNYLFQIMDLSVRFQSEENICKQDSNPEHKIYNGNYGLDSNVVIT